MMVALDDRPPSPPHLRKWRSASERGRLRSTSRRLHIRCFVVTDSHVSVSVRVRDMDRTRLFVWEMHQLVSDMRVLGGVTGPVAFYRERLESLLERYVDGGDDEGGGTLADETTIEETVIVACPQCGFGSEAS